MILRKEQIWDWKQEAYPGFHAVYTAVLILGRPRNKSSEWQFHVRLIWSCFVPPWWAVPTGFNTSVSVSHYIHEYAKRKALWFRFCENFLSHRHKETHGRICRGSRRGRNHQASGFSKVTPPTRTLTAATLSPLVSSTLVTMASCTFLATSGMVPP